MGRSNVGIFASVTAFSAFFVLFAGGLVTSTGSGLAVPDWPMSFDRWMPDMVGGVLFEHGHRVVAGTVAFLTAILTYWVLRVETRKPVRILAIAAAAGILLQALLGGLTVLMNLPPAVSISHACLGQAVFCALLAIAELLKPSPSHSWEGAGGRALVKFGALAVGAIYLQLIFGALYRHTDSGLALALHAVWALGVSAHIVSVVVRTFKFAPDIPDLTRPATLLAFALFAQLSLGVAVYALRSTSLSWQSGYGQGALFATAHLAVGALLLGTAVVWTLRAHRLCSKTI